MCKKIYFIQVFLCHFLGAQSKKLHFSLYKYNISFVILCIKLIISGYSAAIVLNPNFKFGKAISKDTIKPRDNNNPKLKPNVKTYRCS